MELVDLGETFRESSFKVFRSALDAAGVVKAINAKGFAGITIGQADELTEIAKLHGAKGLAFIKVENGEWKSPIVKFFSDAEKTALQSKLNMEEGDCVFFAADKWEIACEVLGTITPAYRRDAKAYACWRNLEFPLGHRLSAFRMESGRKQMERDASSIHSTQSRGHAAV